MENLNVESDFSLDEEMEGKEDKIRYQRYKKIGM